jgi:hypothetical protein
MGFDRDSPCSIISDIEKFMDADDCMHRSYVTEAMSQKLCHRSYVTEAVSLKLCHYSNVCMGTCRASNDRKELSSGRASLVFSMSAGYHRGSLMHHGWPAQSDANATGKEVGYKQGM